ncbi:MAG: hypothetical protein HOK54_12985 [Alphaproteobacteria bacterium]|jgi:hypothetical protein|nr:hypothetical protein [Alphaproteobacteria bacterium]
MTRFLSIGAAAFIGIYAHLALISAAEANVLLNESFDPTRLSGGSRVVLSNDRVGTVSGSEIVFGTSTSNTFGANILDIALFDQGSLNNNKSYKIEIEIETDESLGSGDQDLSLVLQSGSHTNTVMGAIVSDDLEGATGNRRSILFANAVIGTTGSINTFDQNAPNREVLTHASYDTLTVEFEIGQINGVKRISPPGGSFLNQTTFDAGEALILRFFGHNPDESYALNLLNIKVTDMSIPEPNPAMIFCLIIVGTVVTRRMKLAT